MSLAPAFGFSRNERLRARKRIDALFGANNAGGYSYPFRYVILEAGAALGADSDAETDTIAIHVEGEVSVLISVGKKYHRRAHVRNLLKRRTREAYRLNKLPLRSTFQQQGKQLSLGLLYTSKEVVPYSTIEHAIKKIISGILASAV